MSETAATVTAVSAGNSDTSRASSVPPDGLSQREVEVLRMIALGHTNAVIAEQLHLSVRTVETHRAHIQQKLRLTSRSELVHYALAHGLVDEQR